MIDFIRNNQPIAESPSSEAHGSQVRGREIALSIGSDNTLVGVYTGPPAGVEPVAADIYDRPTVLILTAGLVHHTGPFRLHVEIARRLAADGYPSFRFDLAGLGDSDPRAMDVSEAEGAASDVIRVMDHLQSEFGTRRFVLLGLCSGADNAHHAAICDERVVGIVALDALAYPTARFYFGRYLRFARNPLHVLRAIVGKLKKWRAKRSGASERHDDPANQDRPPVYTREFPPKKRVAAELTALVGRGVSALFVYSGGYTYYNYAGQFFDNFPAHSRNPQIEVEFFIDADHTYLLLADRGKLIQRIRSWMTSRFPHQREAVPDETRREVAQLADK